MFAVSENVEGDMRRGELVEEEAREDEEEGEEGREERREERREEKREVMAPVFVEDNYQKEVRSGGLWKDQAKQIFVKLIIPIYIYNCAQLKQRVV